MAPPRVVVIGGGPAGVTLARELAPVASVTLVDRCAVWCNT